MATIDRITGPMLESNLLREGANLSIETNLLFFDVVNDRIGIGNTAPDRSFVVSGNTKVNNLEVADVDLIVPYGSTAQRSSSNIAGLIRVNTETLRLEFNDGGKWQAIGEVVTTVTSDQYVGDGNTTVYSISSTQLTNSVIASINGLVKLPTVDYTVNANVLTFTTAPANTANIEIRGLAATIVVTELASGDGNNSVLAVDGQGIIISTGSTSLNQRWIFDTSGNFTPLANGVYNIGSTTEGIGNLYLSNSTIISSYLITNTATADQIIASLDATVYRSGEFLIQATDSTGGNYQKTTILAIHNGTVAEYTEYGNIAVGGTCGSYSIDYNSGSLRLLVTPASTNSTTFKATCLMTRI